ncbi:PQQ-dependent sugar dehydrogenase [Patescibacteria group bacterium]|nr:PQQ-dependent sugar dehydrogenase [Patescibacteria group bacterium]
MKRLLILVLFLVLFFTTAYFVIVKYYLHLDTGYIRTSFQKPKEDIAKFLPQGSNLSYPLTIPPGFRLAVFADASDRGMPRVLTFDPNGVLFASLTKAGVVVALPDEDKDGIADEVKVVLSELNRPHGLFFHGENLYVAETDKVVRYEYNPENLFVADGEKLFDLPGRGRHFTRTIKVLDGKLYTSVGSSCDVCVEKDERLAAILVSNLDGSDLRVFARGLRNTVFFDFDSEGRIWGSDMGRDFLGDFLPPDELNIIEDGADYGWPYCYGNNRRDGKFRILQPLDHCVNTLPTTFDYPAHVSPLGITFIDSDLFPENDQGNILVAFHGSWNSTDPVGYKIVKLVVEGGNVTSMEGFITGWLKENGDVLGRPVDLVFGPGGVLYISDDKAGLIYILTK